MTRRWVWIGAAAILVLVAGAGIYRARARSEAQPQRARDPGFAVVLAIRTLERTPETRLTKEQISKILPFVKALKDVPTSDAEAAVVIAKAVRDAFTPEQQAALEEAMARFQERVRGQGAPRRPSVGGEGGPPGGAAVTGPGGAGPSAFTEEQRAQMRARTFERMISYLERRMK